MTGNSDANVTGKKSAGSSSGHLRRDYLSFYEIVAQAIGSVAPSGVLGISLAALYGLAGNGTCFTLVVVGLGVLLIGLQVNVFATRVASPGALYVYVAESLGPVAGAIGGTADAIAYFVGCTAAVTGAASLAIGILAQSFSIQDTLALKLCLFAVTIAVPCWLAYRDIKLSARVTLTVELLTILLILSLVAMHFISKGNIIDPSQLALKGFSVKQFQAGLVFAFFCYPGFETAAALGTEAKRPLKLIPCAVLLSIVIPLIFFVVTSYGVIDAFHGITPGLEKQDAPLSALAVELGHPVLGWLITVGVGLGIFAGIGGGANAGGRLLFSLARRGLLAPSIGQAHSYNATPHLGIGIYALFLFVVATTMTLCGIPLMDSFTYLGTLSSFGFLTSYALTSIGAVRLLKKRNELSLFRLVTALAALAIIALPLIGSLYPVPDWPLNILPYIFLSLLGASGGYFLYIRKTDPQRLAKVEVDMIRRQD